MAVVVDQLVEWSLPTLEVRGSNPVIGKLYISCQLYWKDENKEKRGRARPNLKKKKWLTYVVRPSVDSERKKQKYDDVFWFGVTGHPGKIILSWMKWSKQAKRANLVSSVTRLGDLLHFGQLF